jgi:hypothetical protein
MMVEMLRANEEEEANRSCIHVFIFGLLYAYMLSIHCVCMCVCVCDMKRKCTKNSTNLFEMLLLLYFSSMIQRICLPRKKTYLLSSK